MKLVAIYISTCFPFSTSQHGFFRGLNQLKRQEIYWRYTKDNQALPIHKKLPNYQYENNSNNHIFKKIAKFGKTLTPMSNPSTLINLFQTWDLASVGQTSLPKKSQGGSLIFLKSSPTLLPIKTVKSSQKKTFGFVNFYM